MTNELPKQPKGEHLPRVWLRRVDVQDIVACGEGCEADVQTLYSPQSVIVTSMDQYLSLSEANAMIREARAAAFEEAAQVFAAHFGNGKSIYCDMLYEKAKAAREEGK